MSEELKACSICGGNNTRYFDAYKEVVVHTCNDGYVYLQNTQRWQSRPLEDALRAENEVLKKNNKNQYNSLLSYEESLRIRDEERLRLIAKIHEHQDERDALKAKVSEWKKSWKSVYSEFLIHKDYLHNCEIERDALKTQLMVILDCIDYTAGNCRVNEPIGGVLSKEIINATKVAIAALDKREN